jgi:hypothetical protein
VSQKHEFMDAAVLSQGLEGVGSTGGATTSSNCRRAMPSINRANATTRFCAAGTSSTGT